jgi:hypothetical protein
VIVCAIAAVLGTATGAIVLPDHNAATAGGAPSGNGPSATLTSSPASPGPSVPPTASPSQSESGGGPATKASMLKTSDFTQLGLEVTAQKLDDSRITVPSCPQQRRTTVAEIASSDPPLQRVWDDGESVRAYEEAVTLETPEDAAAAITRILRLLESCQETPPGHFVAGPTHRSRPGAGITASWVGIVAGPLNVTGKAPKDPTKIAGGMAVVSNGRRVAVLDLNLCNSGGEQVPCTVGAGDPYEVLDTLTNAAALRLG